VKEAVRWSLRGVSKVLMALGLPGFDQPLAQHYARDPLSLETYFAPVANPFIRDSLLEYCRHMQTIRRPGTVAIYRRALLDFAVYIQSQFPQLTSYAELRRIPHITSWLQHLHEACTDNALAVSRAGHPRPPITVEGRRKRILYVAAFLRRLALWEHPNAPTRVLFDQDDVPSHEEPLPFALEEWQAQRIIEAARTSTNLLGKVATLLLLRTGMRVGELLLLEVNSFVRRRDAASGKDVTWIRVPIIKLGQGREVPLAFDDAQQAVAEWNAHRPFLPPMPHPRSGQLVTFWLAGGIGYGSPGVNHRPHVSIHRRQYCTIAGNTAQSALWHQRVVASPFDDAPLVIFASPPSCPTILAHHLPLALAHRPSLESAPRHPLSDSA